jgi:hypothetical protein
MNKTRIATYFLLLLLSLCYLAIQAPKLSLVEAYDYGYGDASVIYTSQWNMTYDDNMRATWAASEIYDLFAARGEWEYGGYYWDEEYQQWLPYYLWEPVYGHVENFNGGIYEWRVHEQAQDCEQNHPTTAVFYHGNGALENITSDIEDGPWRYSIYEQSGNSYWAATYWYSDSDYQVHCVENPEYLLGYSPDSQSVHLHAGEPYDYAYVVANMSAKAEGHIYVYGCSGPGGYQSHLYVYVSEDGENWDLVNPNGQPIEVTATSPYWIDVGTYSGPFQHIGIAGYDDPQSQLSVCLHIDAVRVVSAPNPAPPDEHPVNVDDWQDVYPYTDDNHRFVFIWSCINGNEVGGYVQGYFSNGTAYGFHRGMAYAWTHRTSLSQDGYANPDQNGYCFICFQHTSKSLSEWPTQQNNYKNWLMFFYEAAINGNSINSALNTASQIVWGQNFGQTLLDDGYWAPNPFYPLMGDEYVWCKLRIFGDGSMVLPN